MKKIFDEIPFSKDYNYDKLTDEETAELVKRLSLTKKGSKAYLAKAITKTVLQIVMLCVLIFSFIFFIDWSDSSDNLFYIIERTVLAVFVVGIGIWCCAEDVKFIRRYGKENETFLIAKGTVVKIREEHIKPDYWHDDGTKRLVTVAVSETEVLPEFDMSFYLTCFKKELSAGDSLVIISYPKRANIVSRYDYLL